MKTNFEVIMREAVIAANEAGDKWVAEHTRPAFAVYNTNVLTGKPVGECLGTMLDVCGFGFVEITDRRTAFAKFIKKTYGSNRSVPIRHKYSGRQEWSLNESTAYAVLGVLNKHGIKGCSVYSRID